MSVSEATGILLPDAKQTNQCEKNVIIENESVHASSVSDSRLLLRYIFRIFKQKFNSYFKIFRKDWKMAVLIHILIVAMILATSPFTMGFILYGILPQQTYDLLIGFAMFFGFFLAIGSMFIVVIYFIISELFENIRKAIIKEKRMELTCEQ